MIVAQDPRILQILDMITQLAIGNDSVAVSASAANDELDAIIIGLNMLAEEIRARVQQTEAMQERLRSAEKLAAVGQLASGLAHEINNPVGVILGFAQGMGRRIAPQDPMRLPVDSITREAFRCKALVQDLLTFARTGTHHTEIVDLVEIVRGARTVLRAQADRRHLSGEEAAPPRPVHVRANRTQLEQVLVNLGTNALDATPPGGSVTVRAYADPDGRPCLEVADTGCGIPAALRQRVFEPFFTTKEPGKGTGLGLSIVHEIVERHRGETTVAERVGGGTVIKVRFPKIEMESEVSCQGHAQASS